jgi:hypothetical protein
MNASDFERDATVLKPMLKPIVMGLRDRTTQDNSLAVQARAQWALSQLT